MGDFAEFFKADLLFKKLKDNNVRLHFDKYGNVVAKGLRNCENHHTVVFLDQFQGLDGFKTFQQAEMLCREFGL